jgi:hypothetical protein
MEGIPFIEFGKAHVIKTHQMRSGRKILENLFKNLPKDLI